MTQFLRQQSRAKSLETTIVVRTAVLLGDDGRWRDSHEGMHLVAAVSGRASITLTLKHPARLLEVRDG